MEPIIDHIHITTTDLYRAENFYDKLLPILGFDLKNKEFDEVKEHDYKIIEYHHKNLSLGIVSPRTSLSTEIVNRRRPGALHHIAFRASSPDEVNEIYEKLKDIKVNIIHKPKLYPEYCEDYYALFFKDSEGIEYEIVYFDRKSYF